MSTRLAELRACADAAAIRGDREFCIAIHNYITFSESLIAKIAAINAMLDRLGVPRFCELDEPELEVRFDA